MDLIDLAKIITYIVPLIGALIALYKFARSIEKRFDNIDIHFTSLDKDLKENTLMTLKLVIMNDDLSLEERIAAGEKYVSLGGNGFIKHYYENLIEEKLQKVE